MIRPDDATLLASLVDQTALAHERLVLEAEARQVDGLRERDRLRGALLGSIAHDLRTPLTAVIAATEAIPAEGDFAEEVRIARDRIAQARSGFSTTCSKPRGSSMARSSRKWESLDLTDVITAVLHDLRQDRPGGAGGHADRCRLPVRHQRPAAAAPRADQPDRQCAEVLA